MKKGDRVRLRERSCKTGVVRYVTENLSYLQEVGALVSWDEPDDSVGSVYLSTDLLLISPLHQLAEAAE